VSRYENLAEQLREAGDIPRIILQDVPAVLEAHKTTTLTQGALFGELSALGRMPRTATIFADEDAEVLEIRWQGLRELRRFDPGWRAALDARSRESAQEFLGALPLFADLSSTALENLAARALFETHGDFEWHASFQRMREMRKAVPEPTIATQGHYPDGLLIIRAGFARLSRQNGNIHQTQRYLGAGSMFAFDELWDGRTGDAVPLSASLHALGFIDLLRVPARALEQFVFPHLRMKPGELPPVADKAAPPATEWCIDERFVNGRRAMLIDLDRCVRCDDCVSACAAAHDGNPRFIRHGRVFDQWMVANACMHCADPVCMIGCPTGAIHRTQGSGTVIINDDTCIGCGTCATACPYDNIRMVEVRDLDGRLVRDKHLQMPIRKATKCDFCEGSAAGPACVNACPHDALSRVDFTGDADLKAR
jgi:Fe-S-cluster-containing dehydrogenase component/CRP-like cAMP-binding protein